MATALEAVLQLREVERQRQEANSNGIANAIQMFNVARQQAKENELKSLLVNAQVKNLQADALKSLRPELSASALNLAERQDQFNQRRLQAMGDDLDPSKNVRNPYGVAQLNVSRAERIEGLVTQYKDLNLDRRETEELAIGLNSLLQGSNVSAQEQVKSLVPKSAVGNVQKMTEWLLNEPQGLNQQKFVQRMLNDVLREKQVSQGQVAKFARAKLAKYEDVRRNNPEDWNNVARSFGIDPEEYDKWKSGGFKEEIPTDVVKRSDVGSDSSVQKYKEGQTATNPKTGQKLTYRNGKWQ